jgi:hypothetical protein
MSRTMHQLIVTLAVTLNVFLLVLKRNSCIRTDIVSFLHHQLITESQPHQDYLKLMKLSLILLGKKERVAVDGDIHFNPPGAYHRARWMSKGIYYLKMYCFREQFILTVQERQSPKRICLFTVTIDVKAWFSDPSSCDAPYNDLCLLQTLESFDGIDKQVSQVALKNMKGHLWYLSEDSITLALFSDKVFDTKKKAMIDAFKSQRWK